MSWEKLTAGYPLRTLTTLKAGGNAEWFASAHSSAELADLVAWAQHEGIRVTPIGWGSNILPSDKGVSGLTIWNAASGISVADAGEVVADSGCGFQELFLKTAQAGLAGLEFAVGIPGTLGGALVSNAGAYRSNISEFVTEIEVVQDGKIEWRSAEWMQFKYRDSVLRQADAPQAVVTRVRLRLPKGDPLAIYNEARDYQRQRIGKQPPSASAGSFFKNVIDKDLAESLPGLSEGMRKNHVVPAGFLIEGCGLKGFRLGGAMVGARHANFLLNVKGATATEIRSLAIYVNSAVKQKFGVELEEEALYLGDWDGFEPIPVLR